jgi:hypothetical protein
MFIYLIYYEESETKNIMILISYAALHTSVTHATDLKSPNVKYNFSRWK